MNREELIKHIKSEIQDTQKIMLDRAEMYNIDKSIILLFDTDFSPEFDAEDSDNHNYDLGRIITLKEILKLLKND